MNQSNHSATPPPLIFAGRTDIGLRRRQGVNQDRYIAVSFDTHSGPATLLAVADGMGGAAGGEVASGHAVEELVRVFNEASPGQSDGEILYNGIMAANRVIFGHAQAEPDLHGMGTTMVAALVRGNLAVIAHVGDSRAYLVRGGVIHQLTADHSWVAEQVRRGEISAEEAATSNFRNVLTRSVGVGEGVAPELTEALPLQAGDTLLLCSDGLTVVVDDGTIGRVAAAADPGTAAQQLIDLANERGGPDNITVVIGRVPGTPAAVAAPRPGVADDEAMVPDAPVAPVEPLTQPPVAPSARGPNRLVLAGAVALLALLAIGGIIFASRRSGGTTPPVTATASAAPATVTGGSATIPAEGSLLARLLPPVPGLNPCVMQVGANGPRLAETPCKFTPLVALTVKDAAELLGVTVECLALANPENASLRPALAGGNGVELRPDQTYRIISAQTCAELRSLGVLPGAGASATPFGR